MNLGKYQLLTQEEVLAIVNFFKGKKFAIAEDVNDPLPGEQFGFSHPDLFAKSKMITQEEYAQFLQTTLHSSDETYRNFWSCGFWTCCDTDLVPQAILKTSDGKFRYESLDDEDTSIHDNLQDALDRYDLS
jgi:hypothetical protein